MNDTAPALTQRYLMVVVQIPFYRNPSGRFFLNELWHKDLLMHLDYIERLTIAAPILNQEPPPDAVPLDLDPRSARLEVIELPHQSGTLQTIKLLPAMIPILWRAVRSAEIVHSAIAGWPMPMGWFMTPLVALQRKRYVIIVESAPWRIPDGTAASWQARFRAAVQESLGRWSLRQTDLAIFTQDGYRQSLLGSQAARGHVIPASWIDEENILSQDAAKQAWEKKLSASPTVRVLFAGRLSAEKGVSVLLDAVQKLGAEGVPFELGILGGGALSPDCENLAATLTGVTRVEVLGTVPYGPPLFDLIRTYDALVVPTLSDEQPRIVYDAYSQAVPVLASDTAGLRSCVIEGKTGLFAQPNSVDSLLALLKQISVHRGELRELGLNSLEYAHSMTHQEMHRKRAVLLHTMLSR